MPFVTALTSDTLAEDRSKKLHEMLVAIEDRIKGLNGIGSRIIDLNGEFGYIRWSRFITNQDILTGAFPVSSGFAVTPILNADNELINYTISW